MLKLYRGPIALLVLLSTALLFGFLAYTMAFASSVFSETYQAEDATLSGSATIDTSIEGFSGSGFVSGLNGSGDQCTFNISVPTDGTYSLSVRSLSLEGTKTNCISLDNRNVGSLDVDSSAFVDSAALSVSFEAGGHTVSISASAGEICLDSITIHLTAAAKTPKPTATPTPVPADTTTPAPTDTPAPTPTDTATPAPTDTATPAPTGSADTPVPSDTPAPTPTDTASLTPTSFADTPAPSDGSSPTLPSEDDVMLKHFGKPAAQIDLSGASAQFGLLSLAEPSGPSGDSGQTAAYSQTYQAEDATLFGSVRIEQSIAGFTGTGYVLGFEKSVYRSRADYEGNGKAAKFKLDGNQPAKTLIGQNYEVVSADPGDKCTFSISVPSNGYYDLNFRSLSLLGDTQNYVFVDKKNIGNALVSSSEFTDSIMQRVYLSAGAHVVSLAACMGSICLDFLKVSTTGIAPPPTDTPPPSGGQLIYQAEDATLSGNVRFDNATPGFTGRGYVLGFKDAGDKCSFTISIAIGGFYDLNFRSLSTVGYKENFVTLDNTSIGNAVVNSDVFVDSIVPNIYLTAGNHTVALSASWGWIDLDALIITASPGQDNSKYIVSARPVNPNATNGVKRLLSFLADNYGKKVLTGQYCETGMGGTEVAAVAQVTGKKPAVLGLDMSDYTPSRVANGTVGKAVELAIDADNKGAIVTMCWHWTPPSKYITGTWWKSYHPWETNINLAAIMDGRDSEGYQLLCADIDAIAVQLKRLQTAGVTVLWRPLHEAAGGWFWWGSSGAAAYKKLYVLLYNKLTTEHGLNNLIWVWNGQGTSWYPGDQYVDMIGEDIYANGHDYSSQSGRFLQAANYTSTKKMIVLSENGVVPDIDLLVRDNVMWGFFATWQYEYVLGSSGYSEEFTEKSMLTKMYNSDKALTLDELPNLKTYPIRQ